MRRPRSERARTRIHQPDHLQRTKVGTAFRAGVSLHSHTWYSREPLTFIPRCASRIPVVRSCLDQELAGYWQRERGIVDFSQGFWRPPLSAPLVFRSEAEQIGCVLGLTPIVSITDHDSIKAGQVLRSTGVAPDAPISLEWSIPFGSSELHVGVHNLPPEQAGNVLRELITYTAGRSTAGPAPLLEWIGTFPDVLIVLNHPLWDAQEQGEARHRLILQEFLRSHAQWLHAVEVNGYRAPAENAQVLALGRELALPVVAGGDRHARAPNTVLNLTRAATFAGFAAEVRDARYSDIAVMPAYYESMRLRKLQSAAEILRQDPQHPFGGAAWTDRIYYRAAGPYLPLARHWPGGPPRWLDTLVRTVTMAPFPLLCRLSRRRSTKGALADSPDLQVFSSAESQADAA